MKTVPFSRARSNLTDLINEVAYAGKRIVLTRKGKRLAAIVTLEDLKLLIKFKSIRVKKTARKAVKKQDEIQKNIVAPVNL